MTILGFKLNPLHGLSWPDTDTHIENLFSGFCFLTLFPRANLYTMRVVIFVLLEGGRYRARMDHVSYSTLVTFSRASKCTFKLLQSTVTKCGIKERLMFSYIIEVMYMYKHISRKLSKIFPQHDLHWIW
jgi:hypothetical protein